MDSPWKVIVFVLLAFLAIVLVLVGIGFLAFHHLIIGWSAIGVAVVLLTVALLILDSDKDVELELEENK